MSVAVSDEFLEYVVDQLSAWGEVRAKRMFGGAGLYHQGKMFGLIADDEAYLKVGEANRGDFDEAGSKLFQPYQHKKTTMPYGKIPSEVLEDRDELARWAEKSFSVASNPNHK
jgi:DNA transformation protein